MLKRILSCLIIFSMLWSDIAAAMDEEDEPTLSLYPPLSHPTQQDRNNSQSPTISLTDSAHFTENSSLLKEGHVTDGYLTLTLMRQIAPSHRSVNEGTGSSSSSDEEDRKDPYPSALQDSFEERGVKKKTCCWPPSWLSCGKCCKKTPLLMGREEDIESIERHSYLVIAERDTSLVELKKQALLAFRPLLKEEAPSHVLSALIPLEEQPVDEQERLLQNARAIAKEFKGTTLEEFGQWFQGHVLDNRYRWQDWGGLLIVLGMAAGTNLAMSDIVEYSIYNAFFAQHLKDYMPIVGPLATYINVSTGLTTLVDAGSFMPEATSPSIRSFTTPKSAREKRADWVLIPLAAITGIYLELLLFQIIKIQQKAGGLTGWWNANTQYFFFTSLGFFPYLVAQSWRGMRTAVSKVFHPTVPEHVKERVLALRQLEARLNHLSDNAIDDLYDLLKHPLLAQNAKVKAWARYLCQGEVAESLKVEGLLSYLSLTNYAKSIMKEEVETEEGGHKTRVASRILAGLGLPAGFSLVAISVFGVLSAFMDWKGALAISILAGALGVAPEAFLQGHNVQETLDDISAKEPGSKRGWKETLKDPYWWGAGTAKVLGTVWSAFQNILTNLAPIFVSLAMLIPQQLGGSDIVQTVMTGVMIGLALPYLCSELLSGTRDMWGHLVGMTSVAHDFCYGIYDRIVACCKKEVAISPRRQKREIRRILKETIETTLRFTPNHVEELDRFERRLKREEVF